MAPLSSALAWRIPGTGEPGGLLSMGLHLPVDPFLPTESAGVLLTQRWGCPAAPSGMVSLAPPKAAPGVLALLALLSLPQMGVPRAQVGSSVMV